jgi:hypothetical protein
MFEMALTILSLVMFGSAILWVSYRAGQDLIQFNDRVTNRVNDRVNDRVTGRVIWRVMMLEFAFEQDA